MAGRHRRRSRSWRMRRERFLERVAVFGVANLADRRGEFGGVRQGAGGRQRRRERRREGLKRAFCRLLGIPNAAETALAPL